MKKAIVTMAMGKFYEQVAEITHPLLRAYAEKCGAELIVWKDAPGHRIPHYRKLEIGKLLKEYDRVAWIDSDILIREDSPSLFEIVPEKEIGLFNEGRYTDRMPAMMSFLAQNGFDPQQWDRRYFNTGVMVFSKAHSMMFLQPVEEVANFYEQTYINFLIATFKPKVHELNYRFNRMSILDPLTGEDRHASYFIHYAGLSGQIGEKETLRVMREDREIWERAKPDYRFKAHIAVFAEGGMGDQICVEPVIRFMRERVYPGDDIIVLTDFPEIFEHLGIPVYRPRDQVPNAGQYHRRYTMRNPEHLSWEFMSHPLCHGTEFAALQAFRGTMPVEARQIRLPIGISDVVTLGEKAMSVAKAQGKDLSPFSEMVLVHPGRGWPTKTFPKDVWQSYIDAILAAGFPVGVIGKRLNGDQGIVEVDTSHPRCLDFVDALSIRELFTIISQSHVLISNDSSPVHIAGAYETWIGLIATCKHPDRVLPYRKGSLSYKAQALEKDGLYWDFKSQPSNLDGEVINLCTEERLRECLPEPERIVEFVRDCFDPPGLCSDCGK